MKVPACRHAGRAGYLSPASGAMIHQAVRYLASTLDWHKVADLGWPIFRLLARLEPLSSPRAGSVLVHGIKQSRQGIPPTPSLGWRTL